MHEWTDLKINVRVYTVLLSDNTNREMELSNVAELNFLRSNSNFGAYWRSTLKVDGIPWYSDYISYFDLYHVTDL